MRTNGELPGPVVIGGVGGSGTRVVAAIVAELGFYLGADIDSAMDNLWFTLLFKRPRWYRTACRKKDQAFTGFSLLTKAMIGRAPPAFSELKFAARAALEVSVFGHNHLGEGRGLWPLVRIYKMFAPGPRLQPTHKGWGWKEPNSHLFLGAMGAYFPRLKYIHTMRHGLDMAFSRNQQQLYNWGRFFGVQAARFPEEESRASLKYWVKANRRVFKMGEKLGRKRFLPVRFEELCLSPESAVQKITAFLGITPGRDLLAKVSQIPKTPRSLGRYRSRSTHRFDPDDLRALESFGYAAPAG